MGQIKRIVLVFLAIAAILAVGAFAGVRYEQYQQAKREQLEEHVDVIAVVNMDEGIAQGEERINYASQLMQMPGDNYVTTGLNEAKTGIGNGTYAAYIVIPENFSESVASVEGNPQKILLEYAFNQRLDAETKEQAVWDVDAFETTLNTNVAYMYIDAIMASFHDVQDDASAILKSDDAELAQLENVNAAELIIPMEQPTLQQVENTIVPVNLEPYLSANTTLLDNMLQEFDNSVKQGMDEFATVQTGHQGVAQATETFFSTYGIVLADTAVKNSEIAADGRLNLEEAIELFNEDVDEDIPEMETQLTALIEIQRAADEIAANTQHGAAVAKLEEEHEGELNEIQKEWETAYEAWCNYTKLVSAAKGNELHENWQNELDVRLAELLKLAYCQGATEALDAVEQNVAALPGAGGGGNTGDSGNTGDGGNTGSTGDSGNTGSTGNTGDGENTGSTGDSGNTGNTGDGGNTGSTGEAGNTGSTGDGGNTGSTGDGGNTGSTGDGGNTGSTGDGGNTGGTGDSGNTGSTGDGGNTGAGQIPGGSQGTGEASYTATQIKAVCDEIRNNTDTKAGDYLTNQGENAKVVLSEDALKDFSIDLTEAVDEEGNPIVPPTLEDDEPDADKPGTKEGTKTADAADSGTRTGDSAGAGSGDGTDTGDGTGTGDGTDTGDGTGTGDGTDTGDETDPSEGEDTPPGIVLETAAESDAQAVSQTAESFAELFALEEDRQAISDIIQDDFVEKFTTEGEKQMMRLSDSERDMSNAMEDYELSLQTYDPFQYFEPNNMTTYLSDIGTNASDMLLDVEENNLEYTKFADDVYVKAMEDVGLMQEAYSDAGEQTAGNVESCIGALQTSRSEVNGQNTDMLENFSVLLPYTRVGSQANPEAYEHIVNPVVSAENGSRTVWQDGAEETQQIPVSDIITIIILAGIAVCVFIIISGAAHRLRENRGTEETV